MYADEEVIVDREQKYVMTIVSRIQGVGPQSVYLHDLKTVTSYTLTAQSFVFKPVVQMYGEIYSFTATYLLCRSHSL